MSEERIRFYLAVGVMAWVVLWLMRGMWRRYWRNMETLTEEEAYWRGYTYAMGLLRTVKDAQDLLERDALYLSGTGPYVEGIGDAISDWRRAGRPFRESP